MSGDGSGTDRAGPASAPARGRSPYPDAPATATVGPGGLVTGWSEGARRLLGHRAAEVVGRAAAELVAGYDGPDLPTGRGATGTGTAVLSHRDGGPVRLTLSWSASRYSVHSAVAVEVLAAQPAGSSAPVTAMRRPPRARAVRAGRP